MSKYTVIWRDESDDFLITHIIFEGADSRSIKDMVILAAEQEYKSFMNEQEVEDAMAWITEHEAYEVIAILKGHAEPFFR
jgi:hypothetical protein